MSTPENIVRLYCEGLVKKNIWMYCSLFQSQEACISDELSKISTERKNWEPVSCETILNEKEKENYEEGEEKDYESWLLTKYILKDNNSINFQIVRVNLRFRDIEGIYYDNWNIYFYRTTEMFELYPDKQIEMVKNGIDIFYLKDNEEYETP